MENPEYFELINTLYEGRDLIGEAVSRGLPTGFYDKATVQRIETLRDIGVLNHELKVGEALRKVIDEMAKGRSVGDFSVEDIKSVVDRYREWYQLSSGFNM